MISEYIFYADSLYKTIGKNVKKYREKANLTQLELSQKMGNKSVSLVSASELCANKKHFNIEHLHKISVILDVDISRLFEDN